MPDELPRFLKLRLTSTAVAVGERIKRGTFRPCVETLPTSTMTGCLLEHFGLRDVAAIGFFVKDTYCKRLFTYAPFDASLGTAKLPLTMEYLAPVEGRQKIEAEVYVAATEETRRIFGDKNRDYRVLIGALRSKGFGLCTLQFYGGVEPRRKRGYLRGALRESDAPAFGIDCDRDVIRPVYGYLFRPDTDRIGGAYERALMPGTILNGPDFLMEEEGYEYD